MQRNYIYSEKELAEKINALQADGHKVIFDRPAHPYWWGYNGYQEFAQKMNVDGYCEVVEVWDIDDSCINDERNPLCVVRHHGHALHPIGTADFYFIYPAYKNQGKYRLYDERERWLPTKYFKTGLKEPNAIGIPTKAKIQAWVGYWREYMKQAHEYVAKNEETLAAQERALLHNYPDAKVYRDGDGVVREIHFSEGGLNFKYERSETGFCRTYTTDYWAVPSFESQTTIKERKPDAVQRAVAVLEEICKKESISDIPHYKLDEAICEVYEILTEAR